MAGDEYSLEAYHNLADFNSDNCLLSLSSTCTLTVSVGGTRVALESFTSISVTGEYQTNHKHLYSNNDVSSIAVQSYLPYNALGVRVSGGSLG